jgi:hypothetical protein
MYFSFDVKNRVLGSLWGKTERRLVEELRTQDYPRIMTAVDSLHQRGEAR